MTDRTPDFYVASCGDGPLDGVRIELPSAPITLTITLENGEILRYEADMTVKTESRSDGTWGDVWRLVETRDAASYDEDLISDIQRLGRYHDST